MAFGAISTVFFPVAANAGASMWGTDVRKFITPADAGNDASCKFAMGTSTSAHTVTADPYTSQGADLTEANYGWAIDTADMNSVSGAQRFMAAGNHVGTLRLQSTTNTNPTGTLTMFVYRVGDAAGGRVRTLLGSATITGQTFDTTIRTYTITVALSQIVFGVDETIQYSFELNGQGVAITGKNNSFYTGTIGGTPAKVDFPTLGILRTVTGFDPAVTFGTPTLTQTTNLAVTGFDVPVSFGTPTVTPDQSVTPSGFDVAVSFGSPVVVPDLLVSPTGFDVPVLFGSPTVVLDNVLAVTGFDVGVGFGAASVGLQPVVSGTVFNHETGDPVGAGITVKLFDDNDVLVDSTVTDAGGGFTFYRPFGDSDLYWTYAEYEISGVQFHGTSDRGCPAV